MEDTSVYAKMLMNYYKAGKVDMLNSILIASKEFQLTDFQRTVIMGIVKDMENS